VVPVAWWEDFDDPVLDTLVIHALERNHDLAAAAWRVNQSLALARIAGADLWPQVGLDARAARAKNNFIGLPIPGGGDVLTSYSTSYDLGLAVSWEIDLWGRIRSAKSAATADFQASWAEFEGARLSVASQTARAWFDLIAARELKALAETTLVTFESTVDRTRQRYERGLTSSLDLRLALTNAANARAAVAAQERFEAAAARRVEVLTGRYPSGEVVSPDRLPDAPAAVPGGLPADLIARRPDLAALERRAAAAASRVSEAKASLYPRISLTAGGGTSSGELQDLVDPDFSVWNLAANILQPIFQGGRLRQNVKFNEAAVRAAVEDFAAGALRAYAEVENALTADATLAAELEHISEAARQSRAAERLADAQYRAGLTDFINVLESQRQAIRAESDLILARAERLAARVDLYLALGGGFTTEPTTAPEAPASASASDETSSHAHSGASR
jgi:NodT family efflux transporter outer membrane factor (OMF) lipoprotein